MAKRMSPAAAKKKADKLIHNKRPLEAQKLFAELIKTTPQDHEVWLGFGLAAIQTGKGAEGEAALRRTLELRPDSLPAYAALAALLIEQKRNHEAEAVSQIHIKFDANDTQAQCRLGLALNRQGKFVEAHEVLSKALPLKERHDADFYVQYGLALLNLGLLDDAHTYLEKALKLQPDNPDVYIQQAALHKAQNEFELARQCYEKNYQLQPDNKAAFLSELAALSECEGDYTKALAILDDAVSEFPNVVDIHWRRAAALLLNSRLQEGWAEYESRLAHPAWLAAMGKCEFSKPRWDGSDLNRKTILVYTEQGFGDAIQFSRYLYLLHEQGACIIFYCDKELLPLFSGLDILERVEPKSYQKAQAEVFDFHVALMSLPHLLNTTLETIPEPLQKLNVAEEKTRYWRKQLANVDGLKVGLVWAGRPTHLFDRRRSCHIEQLHELFDVQGVQFVSLQKGPAVEQLDALRSDNVLELGSQMNDFSDTAAVIKNLDLLISVDTAVVHLSGTLGCPTWNLVYHPAEWRWLLDRDDSPWYPAIKLFRQGCVDTWPDVIRRVADTLRQRVGDS
ncbi:tetratricopeptide repeat protein [Pseudomonadota bacterium]